MLSKKPLFASLALSCGVLLAGAAHAADYLAQADWAETLITHLLPENNIYGSDPTIVSMPGMDGATLYQNRSTCSPFVTRVMKAANGISDASYKSWFGSSSPSSSQYHSAIIGQNHFQRVTKMADIRRGDIIAINYLPCANKSVTGHTMLALSGASARAVDTKPLVAGTVQYELTIADSSSSGHDGVDSTGKTYADTRGAGSGAGIGVLRLYMDAASGDIRGYAWSNDTGSVYYGVEGCRVIAVGRMQ